MHQPLADDQQARHTNQAQVPSTLDRPSEPNAASYADVAGAAADTQVLAQVNRVNRLWLADAVIQFDS